MAHGARGACSAREVATATLLLSADPLDGEDPRLIAGDLEPEVIAHLEAQRLYDIRGIADEFSTQAISSLCYP